jgi:hypothetical protein
MAFAQYGDYGAPQAFAAASRRRSVSLRCCRWLPLAGLGLRDRQA